MVLLYRDPEGETVGTSRPTVRNSSAGMGNTISQVYPAEWEEKVASLEKALRERDAKIATLMTATVSQSPIDLYLRIRLHLSIFYIELNS